MSADNGIYVLQIDTEKGSEYRVAHAHAIDNIYGKYNDDIGRYEGNLECIQSMFGEAKVFYTLNEALDYAEELETQYEYLEDGICVIYDFKDFGYLFV